MGLAQRENDGKDMTSVGKNINCIKFTGGELDPVDTDVVVEAPVTLTVNGEAWVTLMCTPDKLEALAAGFLYNEGIIQSRQDIADLRVCPAQDNVDIWLHFGVEKPEKWRRTTGCTGGVTRLESEKAGAQPSKYNPALKNGRVLTPGHIGRLVENLYAVQELYRKTGGVHTSALSDGERLVVTAEDIGRHNTLDKIAGQCLLEEIWPEPRILLTTGRVSSEMLQKALKIGAAIVISRTSPTSLSVETAQRTGITLIGYARRTQFTVYTHPERVQLANPCKQTAGC